MLKYFNEEWMMQDAGHEIAWREYSSYVLDGKNNFPETCREFVSSEVNIHDFVLTSVAMEKQLVLILVLGAVRCRVVYEGYHLSSKDRIVMDRVSEDRRYSVAYDEFDNSEGDLFHNISFFVANGLDGELQIMFERFSFELS